MSRASYLGLRPTRLFALVLATAAFGCRPPVRPAGEEGASGSEPGPVDSAGGNNGRGAPPSGSTCRSRDDCASAQVCVSGTCRYGTTSRAGEVLAAGAAGQLEAGDVAGAVRTYRQAIEAFAGSRAPVPPEVACGAAHAALQNAKSTATREQAAALAHRCFQRSLPGARERTRVQRGLARLRFDGLDLAAFDRSEPAERYFSQEPTRPTADAVEIALDLPANENTGYEQLRTALRTEPALHAISDCFVQDWELHHQRTVHAFLVLRFQTTMRDMGDYDTHVPRVEVTQTSLKEEGFEPCVATALTEAVRPGPRVGRTVAPWQVPFGVEARVQ